MRIKILLTSTKKCHSLRVKEAHLSNLGSNDFTAKKAVEGKTAVLSAYPESNSIFHKNLIFKKSPESLEEFLRSGSDIQTYRLPVCSGVLKRVKSVNKGRSKYFKCSTGAPFIV